MGQVNSVLDWLLSLLVVLFLLSSIVERLVELYKLTREELRLKPRQPDLAKRRDRQIITAASLIGLVIALLLKADLIALLASRAGPVEVLGWIDLSGDPLLARLPEVGQFRERYPASALTLPMLFAHDGWLGVSFLLRTLVGCALTAALLTMGTRYWHDTLDIILQVRNYTRALSALRQASVAASGGADQLRQQAAAGLIGVDRSGPSFEQIRTALTDPAVRQQLRRPGVQGLTAGYVSRGGQLTGLRGIICYVDRKVSGEELATHVRLPREVSFFFRELRQQVRVPVDILQTGLLCTCPTDLAAGPALVGTHPRKRSGYSVGSGLNPTRAGTITALVLEARPGAREGSCLLLTAGHVLLPPDQERYDRTATDAQPAEVPVYSPALSDQGQTAPPRLGQLARARLDTVDAAVLEVPRELADPHIALLDLVPRSVAVLEEEGDWDQLFVRFVGRTTGKSRSGRITQFSPAGWIRVGDHEYQGFIATDLPTAAGDSGGLLIDHLDRAVGLLVARDAADQAYFLPINRIQEALEIRLVTQLMLGSGWS